MGAKVRVSYEKPQELHTVLKLLQPIVKSCKAEKGQNGQNGRYKKAYVELKDAALMNGNVPENDEF